MAPVSALDGSRAASITTIAPRLWPHAKVGSPGYRCAIPARIDAEVRHVYAKARDASPEAERITIRRADGTPKAAGCEGRVPEIAMNELDGWVTKGIANVVIGGTQISLASADVKELSAMLAET